MRNIKLTISYDGTDYSGWQIQPNGVTIQELLQKAVRQMTGEDNNLVGAGRTDAGVHAFGQVASFRTEKGIPIEGFRKGLNSVLPADIRIMSVEEVPDNFHPIRDSKSKHYRYIISVGESEYPLFLNRSWLIMRDLDERMMREASLCLVGKHDFSAFRAADDCNNGAVREIFDLKICAYDKNIFISDFLLQGVASSDAKPLNKSSYIIDIKGDGFLKNMVRNIVGTLVDVGVGKITPAEFKEIFESHDRKKAGVCAPASGLYLVAVEY